MMRQVSRPRPISAASLQSPFPCLASPRPSPPASSLSSPPSFPLLLLFPLPSTIYTPKVLLFFLLLLLLPPTCPNFVLFLFIFQLLFLFPLCFSLIPTPIRTLLPLPFASSTGYPSHTNPLLPPPHSNRLSKRKKTTLLDPPLRASLS